MTAPSSSAFSRSKLPLIKRIKQSVIFSPPYNIRYCVAFAPVCEYVHVCVILCVHSHSPRCLTDI